jgi:hypothetical protein
MLSHNRTGKKYHSAPCRQQKVPTDNNDNNERVQGCRVCMHFNIIIFWHVTHCSLVDKYHHFGAIYCQNIHGRKRESLGGRLHLKGFSSHGTVN